MKNKEIRYILKMLLFSGLFGLIGSFMLFLSLIKNYDILYEMNVESIHIMMKVIEYYFVWGLFFFIPNIFYYIIAIKYFKDDIED